MNFRAFMLTTSLLMLMTQAQALWPSQLSPAECTSGRMAIQNHDGSLVGTLNYQAGRRMSYTELGDMTLFKQDHLPISRRKKLMLSLNGSLIARVPVAITSQWSEDQDQLISPRDTNVAINLVSLLTYAEDYLTQHCPGFGYQTSGNALREDFYRINW